MGERYERQAGVLGLSLGPATLALGAKEFGKGVGYGRGSWIRSSLGRV